MASITSSSVAVCLRSTRTDAVWPSMTVFLAPMAIGAALTQGPEVLSLAVPLVLSRVLLVYAAGLAVPKGAGPESRMTGFPWLVPLFLLVVAARTYAPLVIFPSVFEAVVNLAKAGIILSLFFLGTILSRDVFGVLRSRAAIAALIAWTLFSFLSLAAILRLV